MASDYVPQVWHDSPVRDTPISAERLAYLEDGVAAHEHPGADGGLLAAGYGDRLHGAKTLTVPDFTITGVNLAPWTYLDPSYSDSRVETAGDYLFTFSGAFGNGGNCWLGLVLPGWNVGWQRRDGDVNTNTLLMSGLAFGLVPGYVQLFAYQNNGAPMDVPFRFSMMRLR